MGIGTQETMVFESEDQRISALKDVPETPENESKIDSILKAPIKAKEEAAIEKPAIQPDTSEKEHTIKEEIKKQETPITSNEELITFKKSDLIAKGFDTPGKLLKSYDEAQSTLERQQKFIKEKLSNQTQDTNLQSVLERAEKALEELNKNANLNSNSKQVPGSTQSKINVSESNLAKIQELKDELAKLDVFDEESQKNRLKLDNLWYDEISRLNNLVTKQMEEVEFAKNNSVKANQEVESYKKYQEESKKQLEAKDALKKELNAIDVFANSKEYSEFKMSKPTVDVENDYLTWGKNVASVYYGQNIDVTDEKGKAAMHYALNMLQKKSPTLIENCKLAGINTEPSENIKKYLDICDLLDYRDGYRLNPATGKNEVVYRYHPPTKSYIPDSFPTIEAAYEHRKVIDGVYAQKIADQYRKGGSDALSAIQKRDNSIVELDNATGASRVDAGTQMTKEQAYDFVNRVDEELAVKMKNDGDPSLFNRIVAAYKIMGISAE